jgi:hypothetical protein
MNAVAGSIAQAEIADPHIAEFTNFFTPGQTVAEQSTGKDLIQDNAQHDIEHDHAEEGFEVNIEPTDNLFHSFPFLRSCPVA